MSDALITSIAAIVGVFVGFGLSWGNNYLVQRDLRKKYGKVFSFELQQLKEDLDYVLKIYNERCEKYDELPDSEEPEEILKRVDFKSKYIFLTKNFEKISIFREDTIMSIIKINSLMEEYDTLRNSSQKMVFVCNLEDIQEEIKNTLQHLKNE